MDSFLAKYEALKDLDISWCFIGHLQRNKAKEVANNKMNYLHSFNSAELVEAINRYISLSHNCFIERSIDLEDNKIISFYRINKDIMCGTFVISICYHTSAIWNKPLLN